MSYYNPSYGSSYYTTHTYGTSTFSQVIVFFEKLGLYDIILPFLLVFTIVFAVFERTRVLGTEKIDGEDYPKKSLNAMVSFVIAFLVIASSRMVAIINESLPKIVILIFLCVFFLLLVGIFYSEKEEVVLSERWRIFFMVILFIAIVLIFMHSIPTHSGQPFLYWLLEYVYYNFRSTVVSSVVMMLVVFGIMAYIVMTDRDGTSKKSSDD